MRGSVKRRGDTWTYTVDLPRGVDGKRRQRRRGGFPTRKQAEESLREFLGHVDRGGDPFDDRTTFAQYAAGWAEHHRTTVAPRTMDRYDQLIRIHLLPQLGGMRLRQIRPAHVQAAFDSIDRSPATVRQARAVLSRMMRSAVQWGLLPASPVPATTTPRVDKPDLTVPDVAGTQTILAASVGGQWEMPVLLSAYLGTRRGETLALRWADLDLNAGRVRIMRSLEHRGGEYREKQPKSARGSRSIGLPVFLVERLRRWKVEQTERRLAAGPAWHDLDLICDRGDGYYIDPDAFTKGFKRLARAVGMEGVRLHDLRHGAASTLLAAGVSPLVVSRSLGHASEAFTMSTYGHVRPEMLDQWADALGEAYGNT